MSKKIDFGSLKKELRKELNEPQNSKQVLHDKSVNLEEKDLEIDRLNTAIENLQRRLEVQAEEFRAESQQQIEISDNYAYQLKLKETDIENFKAVNLKQQTLIENLSVEVSNLKEKKGFKTVQSGLKTKIDETKIKAMREYALGLDDKKDFYKKIKEKFKVSVGSAHNYTKDIYEKKFKGEHSND